MACPKVAHVPVVGINFSHNSKFKGLIISRPRRYVVFWLTDFTQLLHALAVLRSEQAQHSLPFLLDSSVHLKRILSSLVPELTTEILIRTRVALGKARQDVIHLGLCTAVGNGLSELELVFLVVLVYQPALENVAFGIVIKEMLLVFAPENFKLNTPSLGELFGMGA